VSNSLADSVDVWPVPEGPTLRNALERKLVLWTVIMVVVPTFVCALWLNSMTRTAMSEAHARNVTLLSQTLAAALAGRIEGNLRSAIDVIDAMDLDRRIAFVAITDPDLNPLHRQAADPEAWASYHQWEQDLARPGAIDVNRPIVLGRSGDLVVHKVPVWNPPASARQARAPDHRAKLEGYIILALREQSMPQTLAQLRAAMLAAACAICLLSLPVVVWAVRYWTAPLRSLLEATIRLAAGEAPPPVPVDSHDELGVVAEAFNRMARKLFAARRQLQRANEELERKVAQRTAELEQANRKLETEITDRNDFLRTVTHDLSAPLRNIDGMASMLMMKYREQLADDAVNKLQRISANVKSQAELINDLMELSRLRTRGGRRELVDLQDLVEQLRQNLSFDLEQKKIDLRIVEPLPHVFAERNRMRQVFQNLLDNAIKYMLDARDRQITLHFKQEDHWLRFTVRDTGRGIAKQDQARVFQVFRRATHSGGHDVPGRGVGLASVKTIVECYGGQIWVESELGQGSAFHFTLDHRLVQAPAPEQHAEPA
jgi:signal transduction histidine kinase